MSLVADCPEDSTTSFDVGSMCDLGRVCTQPMRQAKLHRSIVVDANLSYDLEPEVSGSCANDTDTTSSVNSIASTRNATTSNSSSGHYSMLPAGHLPKILPPRHS